MKVLRAITGKTLRDRIRNDAARKTCDIKDIVRWRRYRRHLWRDHVDRMSGSKSSYIAAHEIPSHYEDHLKDEKLARPLVPRSNLFFDNNRATDLYEKRRRRKKKILIILNCSFNFH